MNEENEANNIKLLLNRIGNFCYDSDMDIKEFFVVCLFFAVF